MSNPYFPKRFDFVPFFVDGLIVLEAGLGTKEAGNSARNRPAGPAGPAELLVGC